MILIKKHRNHKTEQLCMYGKDNPRLLEVIHFDCYCETCNKAYKVHNISIIIIRKVINKLANKFTNTKEILPFN